jgi:hypothetical protein
LWHFHVFMYYNTNWFISSIFQYLSLKVVFLKRWSSFQIKILLM